MRTARKALLRRSDAHLYLIQDRSIRVATKTDPPRLGKPRAAI